MENALINTYYTYNNIPFFGEQYYTKKKKRDEVFYLTLHTKAVYFIRNMMQRGILLFHVKLFRKNGM